MRRLALCVLLLVALPALAAEQEVRTFAIKNRTASEAVAAVAGMLSADGSIALQPRANTLVVRDTREALDRVAAFLSGWDIAPGPFRVHIRLFMASNEPPTPATGQPHFGTSAQRLVDEKSSKPSGPRIATIEDRLARLFPFKYFRELDSVEAVGSDGSVIEAVAARRYYIRFTLRVAPSGSTLLQLSHLELVRQHAPDDASASDQPMLATSLNLRVGQLAVLGAAPSEEAARALVLVFQATPEAR